MPTIFGFSFIRKVQKLIALTSFVNACRSGLRLLGERGAIIAAAAAIKFIVSGGRVGWNVRSVDDQSGWPIVAVVAGRLRFAMRRRRANEAASCATGNRCNNRACRRGSRSSPTSVGLRFGDTADERKERQLAERHRRAHSVKTRRPMSKTRNDQQRPTNVPSGGDVLYARLSAEAAFGCKRRRCRSSPQRSRGVPLSTARNRSRSPTFCSIADRRHRGRRLSPIFAQDVDARARARALVDTRRRLEFYRRRSSFRSRPLERRTLSRR